MFVLPSVYHLVNKTKGCVVGKVDMASLLKTTAHLASILTYVYHYKKKCLNEYQTHADFFFLPKIKTSIHNWQNNDRTALRHFSWE